MRWKHCTGSVKPVGVAVTGPSTLVYDDADPVLTGEAMVRKTQMRQNFLVEALHFVSFTALLSGLHPR